MDIFDIIIVPPNSTINIVVDSDFISLIIFGISFLISAIIAFYYRRFIAICSLNYVAALVQQNKISYKNFAYLLARIICYRHKTTRISKINPPVKSSKDKHYLWIALVDSLDSARYGKDEKSINQSFDKLYKTASEWLRYS